MGVTKVTAEDRETIARLWYRGWTGARIATELGYSRPTIMGIVNANGYQRKPGAAGAPVERAPVNFAAAHAVLALAPRDCRWPMGDPAAPDFRFCGKPRHEGARTRYCTHHLGLAWNRETREANGIERVAVEVA